MVEKCPVCNSVAKQIDHLSSREYYTECVRCGTFKYNQYTHEIVSKFDLSKKLALSHWIRKQNEIGNQPDFQGVIYTKEFLESLELPNAGEQADNLIKYLGEKIKAVSSGYQFNYNEQFGLCAIIGCMTIEDLIYIINYLVKDKKLIRLLNPNSDMQYLHRNKQYFDIGLAPEGWVKIEEFKKKLATNFVAKEQENTKSINSPIVIDNKESKTNNLDSNNIEIKDSKKTPLYKSMLFWAIVSVVVAVVFGVLNYDPSNSIENNENSNSIIVQGDNNTVNYNSNNSTEISNNSENELQELLRNIAEENKIDISDELLNSYANAVANIYKTISKDSEVTLSDTIELKNKKSYIFDIGIKTKSLGHDIYLAIKLLPLKREARLSDIPEFIRAIDETRAKGIVICNSGFSKELIKYAYDNLIDLCVLKDAQSKDWSDNIEIPVVWVRANPIFFPEFVMSVLKGDTIPVDLISTKLSYNNGKNAFTLGEVLIDNWENGDYPKQTDSLYTTVFKTRDLKLNINNTHDWRKIDLLKIYYTTRDEYFIKYIQPKVYKAIENYISKDVEFTDIEMKIDYLDENREWKKIGEDIRKDFSKGDDIELPDGLYIFATTTKESLKFANVKTSDLNIRKMIKNKKK